MINDGPKIVTNGLVLCLDARNTKSYSGSGTTWYDLSGYDKHAVMNNFSASNFTTFNGVRCFESDNTSNQCFKTSNFTFPTSGRTYEIWVAQKAVNIGWQTWIDDNNTDTGYVFLGLNNASIYVYPQSFGATVVTNQWYNVIYTLAGGNGSAVKLYINGALVGSGTYTGTPITGSGTLYILGDDNNKNENSSAYGSIVRAYNRVLSESEINQNFQATRDSFGL